MTRKDFLKTTAGVIAVSAIPAASAATAEKKGPKRGVSVYSYSDDIYKTCTLEDCLASVGDLRSEEQPLIGLEILGNAHIDGYPHPTDAWVKNWFEMISKYHLKPVEYGFWIESKLYNELEPWQDTKSSCERLVRDIKLANRLGFTHGRAKIGVIDGDLDPVPNWREIYKMALPVAEKYNFRMLPEIHAPTKLKSKMIDDYVDFIEKEKTTPWFGLNIDFGVFQNKPTKRQLQAASMRGGAPRMGGSTIDDMIPLLPYVHCCHAKFMEMNDDCEEVTTPYPDIIKMLKEHNWDGYMMSEYEGEDRAIGGAFSAVRKQHVMLRKLLES